MAVRDRIIDFRRIPAAELRANPRNWRRHPPAQENALRSVLEKVGYADALLARETPDGLELVDGHLRKEISANETVPVLVLDVDEAEAALILATFDPLGAMAVTDEQALYELLQTVIVPDAELARALEEMTGQAGPPALSDPDEVPEPPAEPTTKPGDLWLLGGHRLLCGDSTSDIPTLMGPARADLVLTDPPYGVDIQERDLVQAEVRGRRKDRKGVTNDDLTGQALADFLAAAFAAVSLATRPGASWYVCAPPGVDYRLPLNALADLGVARHGLVWVKDRFVMGRADYHYRHENVIFGWTPAGRTTLWRNATWTPYWSSRGPGLRRSIRP